MMSEIVALETPRLKLRQWRDSDLDAWAAMSSDTRVMEYFAEKLDRAAADAMAKRMRDGLERDGYGWWALEIKGGPEFVGVIALQEVPLAARFSPATEIGWRLAAGVWGNGYATEGARAALDFAFGHLNRQEVVAITAASNVRSQHVMQRLGMTYDREDDFDHPRLEPGHPLRITCSIDSGDPHQVKCAAESPAKLHGRPIFGYNVLMLGVTTVRSLAVARRPFGYLE